jgi:WD40 repeat protein
VTVNSSSGSAIAHTALTYQQPAQQFSLPGSSLAQGVYDPYRDLYYFTDINKIQVFSKTLGALLPPMNISPPAGATQRLWGIALSPDGTKLAVADIAAGVIYVLNPSNPSSVKTFSVSAALFGTTVFPAGVAISDTGMVYFAAIAPGISGADGFFKLDTNTSAITDYGLQGSGSDLLRTAISSDNSRVFFNDDGYVFNIDTATDKRFSASVDTGCCYGNYELSLSANQTQFEASGYLYDSNLNSLSFLSLNDREILTAQYVYGNKLSPDGTLLFQPAVDSIDIFDGRLGNLLQRVSLPFALSQNYDALVSDGKDNVLIAITGVSGDGVAVVDLSSVAEPGPLPFPIASSVKAARLVPWLRSKPLNNDASATRKARDVSPHIPPHVLRSPSQ